MRETRTRWRERFANLIAGIEKHLEDIPMRVSLRPDLAPARVAARLRAVLAAAARSDDAYAAWRARVKEERELLAEARPVARWMTLLVLGTYGNTGPTADFGVVPPRVGTKSTEVKVRAAAKARATRAARHTMGKRQRRRVKGG